MIVLEQFFQSTYCNSWKLNANKFSSCSKKHYFFSVVLNFCQRVVFSTWLVLNEKIHLNILQSIKSRLDPRIFTLFSFTIQKAGHETFNSSLKISKMIFFRCYSIIFPIFSETLILFFISTSMARWILAGHMALCLHFQKLMFSFYWQFKPRNSEVCKIVFYLKYMFSGFFPVKSDINKKYSFKT